MNPKFTFDLGCSSVGETPCPLCLRGKNAGFRLLTSGFWRPVLIAFNKPFGVLSQFTSDGSPNRALAEFNFPKDIWPIGRLDADSEGLLLLSDEPALNEKLLHPRLAHQREYWVQVRANSIVGRTQKTRARRHDPRPQNVALPRLDVKSTA